MSARSYHADGAPAPDGAVFVFGSNLSGMHGGGAARAAHETYGAKWGACEGLMGRSYAIPTVRERIAGPLDLQAIRAAVDRFVAFAAEHSATSFHVTRVGCGLAGHSDSDIAPMFRGAPQNCSFAEQWREHLEAV